MALGSAGACLGRTSMALNHKVCHVVDGSFDLPHAETHTIMLPHAIVFSTPAAIASIERGNRTQRPGNSVFRAQCCVCCAHPPQNRYAPGWYRTCRPFGARGLHLEPTPGRRGRHTQSAHRRLEGYSSEPEALGVGYEASNPACVVKGPVARPLNVVWLPLGAGQSLLKSSDANLANTSCSAVLEPRERLP